MVPNTPKMEPFILFGGRAFWLVGMRFGGIRHGGNGAGWIGRVWEGWECPWTLCGLGVLVFVSSERQKSWERVAGEREREREREREIERERERNGVEIQVLLDFWNDYCTCGPMDPRIHGSMESWIHGSSCLIYKVLLRSRQNFEILFFFGKFWKSWNFERGLPGRHLIILIFLIFLNFLSYLA